MVRARGDKPSRAGWLVKTMSVRDTNVRSQPVAYYARQSPLRSEIEALRAANAASERELEVAAAADSGALMMEDLNETERSAATIGVSPDAWKPISWMNASHYHTLLTSNAIGGRLAQQIEAFKSVAQS